ncbi:tetratricopeptide repeat protein [Undibacterium sp. TJN19]|uniref:tetratricopeptide repeat protein n=1 Tax=Undibacterium sp. TJN19 TaxID=3413055 RepID=UPI003BF124BB
MTPQTDTAETLFYKANELMGKGEFAAAEQAFRLALVLEPDLAEIHANLAWLLEQQKRYAEAEQCYRQALLLAPWQLQILSNFAVMLAALKRFDEAEALYRQALLIDDDAVSVWSNLGVLLACTWREDEAEKCYRRSLELAPGYRKAAFNLAYLLLRQGRYEEGWQRLESRDGVEPLEKELRETPEIDCWQGQDLTGKSILICFEAGHGDMLQFCRYASLLKKRGASRVSIHCHPGLKTLMTGLDGVDDAIALGEAITLGNWHYWVALYSLPRLFMTRIDTIPGDLPYLSVASGKILHWAGETAIAGNALRVGLVWKGNPNFENDADRSMLSLRELAMLGEVPGVQFFSLQKGAGEAEARNPPAPLSLADLAPGITDFSDTAAIILNLDLVIAVDTAVVHLAGALGKPCWVMLPAYRQDWRWLKDRQDSPWYPGVMRIFRQTSAGDWSTVVAEIKMALVQLKT